MQITKIVITGGPCAGKSTAMSWVQNAFTELGYTVLSWHYMSILQAVDELKNEFAYLEYKRLVEDVFGQGCPN